MRHCNERGQELCSRSYGTRSVPTTINVYLFFKFTIVFGFLTILFEKSQLGNRLSNEVSGLGNPSHRRLRPDRIGEN